MNAAIARLSRWSAACWVAAGVLFLGGIVHPDVFATTLADASLGTPFWVPMHAAITAALILTLTGVSGLYASRAERLGALGLLGFTLAVPGLVIAACGIYAEAFLLPAIAVDSPELLAWDGPVLTSWTVRTTAGLALLWPVGLFLLVLACWRSRLIPRAAAVALCCSMLAFALFAGPFVPIFGPLSTVAFAAAHVGVGIALWTGTVDRPAHRSSGAPPSGASDFPAEPAQSLKE
jgi:hypothetical protein